MNPFRTLIASLFCIHLKHATVIGGLMLCALSFANAGGGGHASHDDAQEFPISEATYHAMELEQASETGEELGLIDQLKLRASADPINVVATVIFLLAVAHTFLATTFNKLAHKYEVEHHNAIALHTKKYVEGKDPVSFKSTLFHFLGEVEAIFGIWLIPLLLALVFMKPEGFEVAAHYIDNRNFTEPMFVVIIMAIASSRPVIQIAETCLRSVASIGKRTPAAWWLSILVVAPLLGSFITEPAAMTIAALLIGHQFYMLDPSPKFKYATLGLLFVNISVGGTLTHFAAPPVLMVANAWHWNMPFMFTHFGWRAVLGIVVATAVYFFIFKKEFKDLAARHEALEQSGADDEPEPAPYWIIIVHLGFVAWTVLTLHHPAFFIAGFLFFLAFTMATHHHQYDIKLKSPILVGFFLAGLVTHGGLQGWWISPVLSSLAEVPLFIGATILTAFNDNAAITFLASQVPVFSPDQFIAGQWISKTGAALANSQGLEYAVVAGAVTGGGLTVIANAPNPAGQSILSKYFKDGVSPFKLLLGALFPTLVMACVFIVLPH
ncbi:putative Na+/H+ antiporter [Lentimonas sp. CC6]|uniref:putative Na+/H+ antiporter n=2 Tax=Lentimonas TaxID=417293 RepID=UPI001327E89B|nr:putative Na+/H+ antiporter [Lentimonas sp. CC6]CAA6678333.1 putative membrane protein [Lentimonas sp. CC4]CAA7170729.1 putative membrane protein [Lentimonas sp. CC21]CAA7179709.1 putative membrane protein [Lentimonas sp. CC8]CAA6685425.1 putative membrane protein [Lentimonas sp. CC6]CAA7076873.1 putative membrane protein [Lentimonas sp. CC4]